MDSNILTVEKIWNNIFNKITKSEEIPAFEIQIYFYNIKPVELTQNGTNLVLNVGTKTKKITILKKYEDFLKKIIYDIYPSITNITLTYNEEILNNKNEQNNEDKTKTEDKNITIDFQENNIFNPDFTFENFVCGVSNVYAYKAMQSIAVNFNNFQSYNILFITGNSGLGKTHLLHSLGNYLNKHYKNKNILYTTTEQYTNDFIFSLSSEKKNSSYAFKEKYRNLDLLMIDDFQFIENKESTEESFFHTLNSLILENKKIIICADKPFENFISEERMLSRLKSGVCVHIDDPDKEMRFNILKKKAQKKGFYLSDEILNYLSETFVTNVRVLEGILNSIIFYCTLFETKCDSIEKTKEILKEQNSTPSSNLTIEGIVNIVANYFNLKQDVIIGKSREANIVFARHICFYLISTNLSITKSSIAKFFSNRNHSTVISGIKNIENNIKNNTSNIKKTLNILNEQIRK